MKYVPFVLMTLLICACADVEKQVEEKQADAQKPAALSLSGKPLYAAKPSEKLLTRYQQTKKEYESDSLDADKLIWYGRFTAYQSKYEEAIKIFTKGITLFPDDPRMYRHRGHRYISIRLFDAALKDLTYAAKLIKGKENEIEPDGMPNAQNIPVSTLHGNIWYHLGLAYYLKHDFNNALKSYRRCLQTSTNADNVVSSTHWLYMIHRRLGDQSSALLVLDSIKEDMPVIENMDYHKACLFYKDEIKLKDLIGSEEASSAGKDAVDYAIGNWYLYNDQREEAKKMFELILKRDSWNSFGYIAAEKDYLVSF